MFDDFNYIEIGNAKYNLYEITTIKGASIHGPIRFGKNIFINDSIFFTTAIYSVDEDEF